MESVNDAINKWLEKWKQAAEWDPEDSLSVEFNADYWDDEEDNHPPRALRRSAKNRIIKEAIESGRVIDLDRIYKDGKIFGYEMECQDDICLAAPITKIVENGHEYYISFRIDWPGFNLQIQGVPAVKSKRVPGVIRLCFPLDNILSLKYDLMEYAVRDTVNRIIAEFERRYNDYD